MKNYLGEWKKFKNKILNENVQQAKIALNAAQQREKAAKQQHQALNTNLALAQQETKAAEEALKNAEREEQIQASTKATSTLPSGPTSPTTTTGTMEEAGNQTFSGLAADSVQVPVSVVDEKELTEEEMDEASGCHEGVDEGGSSCQLELEYEVKEEEKTCNECRDCLMCGLLTEAKYKGRTVTLNKPMRGDVKKFKVFVRDPSTGNIKKVNFGDKKMRIKKSNPKRRKSFRARHNCANPGPKTKARYWSCKKW
jgi:hypothetical protein